MVSFYETYLCHGPGDIAGQPLVLDDEFYQLTLDAYRIYPRDHPLAGRRVGFDTTISRPKGRAKSEWAGMVTVGEFTGPARFDGWDAAGNPVGKPVTYPFIRCLATEESQAGNTYDNVQVMLTHAIELDPRQFGHIDVGATRVYMGRGGVNGEIRPSSAGSASKDGGKETFAVADETHLYILPELKSMLRMIRRNLRKRKIAEPWFLQTTTMFGTGQNSAAEGRFEAVRKVKPNSSRRDLSVIFDHREAPPVKDWDDDKEMLAALAEVYGPAAEWMDLRGILAEIRDPEADPAESQRYFLNQRAQRSESAFDSDKWDELGTADDLEPGELITLGFDGARFDDSTALVGCSVKDGSLHLLGLWEKDGDDWEVDVAEVKASVDAAFEDFEVWRMYGDPPYWETPLAELAGKWGEKRVIEWWTNRTKQMAFALKGFDTAIRTGEVSHDGDKDLARHIANCVRREAPRAKDDEGRPLWTIGKERAGSPRKIDAAMAAVLAWEARADAVAAGALKKTPATVTTFF